MFFFSFCRFPCINGRQVCLDGGVLVVCQTLPDVRIGEIEHMIYIAIPTFFCGIGKKSDKNWHGV